MKRTLTAALSAILLAFGANATDTLSIEQCRDMALQNSPLQQKKQYAENIAALQIRNLQSNTLPRIQLGAQASWQSDVFGLPFKFPGSEVPEVPKDQYKLSAEISERLWDGGSDRIAKQQRALERDLAAAQVDVDVFTLREVVTDLFFKALLLQENEAILEHSKEDLQIRLRQTEAAVAEGVALRTSADQVKIQILKIEQQITGLKADALAVKEILARWMGAESTDFRLKQPSGASTSTALPIVGDYSKRPEFRLFELQHRGYQVGKNALSLRQQPRVEAYLQGGLGRPNPFNFFETGFEPFALIGLRAAWTPIDWGNTRRDAQVFDLQMQSIEIQRAALRQRLDASVAKDKAEQQKYRQQIAQDDAIIELQQDILRRADAQVKNGVMTMAEYLSQLNLLTQTLIAKKTHEIQAAQSLEMWRAKTGE